MGERLRSSEHEIDISKKISLDVSVEYYDMSGLCENRESYYCIETSVPIRNRSENKTAYKTLEEASEKAGELDGLIGNGRYEVRLGGMRGDHLQIWVDWNGDGEFGEFEI
jgi:hypothetical protein